MKIFFDQKSNQEVDSFQLSDDIENFLKNFLIQEKSLCFIFCDQTYSTVLAYLSLLNSNHATLLCDANQFIDFKKKLISLYQPRWIWSPNLIDGMDNYHLVEHSVGYLYKRKVENNYNINKELKLLLSSSGTTGSPKLIRLSAKNLQSNASSIVNYLNIRTTDKAITSLPLHYSFGLSVLNSFLEANANVVLTGDSIVSKRFWQTFKEQEVSFLAGVPFSFEMLNQLRFEKMHLPSLSCLVQAGGRLAPDKIEIFEKIAKEKKTNFYVMYGQTEATARISYVPPERLKDKYGSIGIAIPDGKLYLEFIDESFKEGELIYEGPNVMLGYANSIEDLALGDQMEGKLQTGDLAKKDEEGYFYLTGRIKRFLKLFGLRFNLDEAEVLLSKELNCSTICFGNDDCLQIRIESHNMCLIKKAIEIINNVYRIHHSKVNVQLIDQVPRTSSGKIKYDKIL